MTGHHFVILIILSVILSGSEESVFSPIIIFHILTCAHATLILRHGRHLPCALLHGGTAEHEHVALISYWFTTRYKKPLFVVRILE